MKQKLLLLSTIIASIIATPIITTAAETDYSYLEDMSVKDLKALDAAIHELLGNVPVSEIEAIAEPVHMTEEEFFEDIVESYNTRSIIADSGSTTSEWNSMSSAERVQENLVCAEAERPFYEKYKNAVFDDLNIQYLCSQYIEGLTMQYNSKTIWENTQNYDSSSSEYRSGYYRRAYVIVELSDYWDLSFGDVSTMREDTAYMDSLNEAETRNSQVPHETVKEVQTLLHEVGFKCWNIDGVAGKRTVKAIKRFQEMYGFEVDGMITDELIEHLKQVKADKGLVDESETETETETETTTE